MAVLVQADIRDEVRDRVGDDDSTNYFMSDSAMNRHITNVYLELFKYARNEAENTSLSGNGTSIEFTLPATIVPNLVKAVYLRSGSDVTTDLPVIYYKIFNGKLRMPTVVASGTTIVIQYRLPYTIADDVNTTIAEMLYELMEIAWIDYAAKKRADFEQWATIRRSDASIGELMQLRRQVKNKLEELTQEVSRNLEITDVWGGV